MMKIHSGNEMLARVRRRVLRRLNFPALTVLGSEEFQIDFTI
jgi:hypothetical protein